MVRRMVRLDREYLLNQRINSQIAERLNPSPAIVVQLQRQECLGFDILGKFKCNRFQGFCVFLGAFFFLLIAGFEIGIERLDVKAFSLGYFVLAFDSLRNETLCTFLLTSCRLGSSPIGHGTIRVQCRRLSKRTLRLEEPETVELAETLLHKFLGHFVA